MLLERLDFGAAVRAALAHTFERWNGNGFPNGTPPCAPAAFSV